MKDTNPTAQPESTPGVGSSALVRPTPSLKEALIAFRDLDRWLSENPVCPVTPQTPDLCLQYLKAVSRLPVWTSPPTQRTLSLDQFLASEIVRIRQLEASGRGNPIRSGLALMKRWSLPI